MFQKNQNKLLRLFLFAKTILLVVGMFYSPVLGQGKKTQPSKLTVDGRVFGRVDSLIAGAGVGPSYQHFVFEVTKHTDRELSKGKFIRVLYQYFDRKNRLTPDFFDYSMIYRVKLTRKATCDDNLTNFGYEQNGDLENPTQIFQILAGADSKRLSESMVLQCYTLNEREYKAIPQKKYRTSFGKYDKNLPSIYLTLEKRAGASLKQLAKSKALVLFRLHNNLKTGIQIEASGAEEGLGDASIYYDVLDQKGELIESHPCHVCSLIILKGGRSLLFAIPKEEVSTTNALRIDFEYLWETDEPTLLGQEPIHQVVMRFEKLKIDWSKLD